MVRLNPSSRSAPRAPAVTGRRQAAGTRVGIGPRHTPSVTGAALGPPYGAARQAARHGYSTRSAVRSNRSYAAVTAQGPPRRSPRTGPSTPSPPAQRGGAGGGLYPPLARGGVTGAAGSAVDSAGAAASGAAVPADSHEEDEVVAHRVAASHRDRLRSRGGLWRTFKTVTGFTRVADRLMEELDDAYAQAMNSDTGPGSPLYMYHSAMDVLDEFDRDNQRVGNGRFADDVADLAGVLGHVAQTMSRNVKRDPTVGEFCAVILLIWLRLWSYARLCDNDARIMYTERKYVASMASATDQVEQFVRPYSKLASCYISLQNLCRQGLFAPHRWPQSGCPRLDHSSQQMSIAVALVNHIKRGTVERFSTGVRDALVEQGCDLSPAGVVTLVSELLDTIEVVDPDQHHRAGMPTLHILAEVDFARDPLDEVVITEIVTRLVTRTMAEGNRVLDVFSSVLSVGLRWCASGASVVEFFARPLSAVLDALSSHRAERLSHVVLAKVLLDEDVHLWPAASHLAAAGKLLALLPEGVVAGALEKLRHVLLDRHPEAARAACALLLVPPRIIDGLRTGQADAAEGGVEGAATITDSAWGTQPLDTVFHAFYAVDGALNGSESDAEWAHALIQNAKVTMQLAIDATPCPGGPEHGDDVVTSLFAVAGTCLSSVMSALGRQGDMRELSKTLWRLSRVADMLDGLADHAARNFSVDFRLASVPADAQSVIAQCVRNALAPHAQLLVSSKAWIDHPGFSSERDDRRPFARVVAQGTVAVICDDVDRREGVFPHLFPIARQLLFDRNADRTLVPGSALGDPRNPDQHPPSLVALELFRRMVQALMGEMERVGTVRAVTSHLGPVVVARCHDTLRAFVLESIATPTRQMEALDDFMRTLVSELNRGCLDPDIPLRDLDAVSEEDSHERIKRFIYALITGSPNPSGEEAAIEEIVLPTPYELRDLVAASNAACNTLKGLRQVQIALGMAAHAPAGEDGPAENMPLSAVYEEGDVLLQQLGMDVSFAELTVRRIGGALHEAPGVMRLLDNYLTSSARGARRRLNALYAADAFVTCIERNSSLFARHMPRLRERRGGVLHPLRGQPLVQEVVAIADDMLALVGDGSTLIGRLEDMNVGAPTTHGARVFQGAGLDREAAILADLLGRHQVMAGARMWGDGAHRADAETRQRRLRAATSLLRLRDLVPTARVFLERFLLAEDAPAREQVAGVEEDLRAVRDASLQDAPRELDRIMRTLGGLSTMQVELLAALGDGDGMLVRFLSAEVGFLSRMEWVTQELQGNRVHQNVLASLSGMYTIVSQIVPSVAAVAEVAEPVELAFTLEEVLSNLNGAACASEADISMHLRTIRNAVSHQTEIQGWFGSAGSSSRSVVAIARRYVEGGVYAVQHGELVLYIPDQPGSELCGDRLVERVSACVFVRREQTEDEAGDVLDHFSNAYNAAKEFLAAIKVAEDEGVTGWMAFEQDIARADRGELTAMVQSVQADVATWRGVRDCVLEETPRIAMLMPARRARVRDALAAEDPAALAAQLVLCFPEQSPPLRAFNDRPVEAARRACADYAANAGDTPEGVDSSAAMRAISRALSVFSESLAEDGLVDSPHATDEATNEMPMIHSDGVHIARVDRVQGPVRVAELRAIASFFGDTAPLPSQLLVCTRDTRDAEIDRFLDVARHVPNSRFAVLRVDALLPTGRDRIIQHLQGSDELMPLAARGNTLLMLAFNSPNGAQAFASVRSSVEILDMQRVPDISSGGTALVADGLAEVVVVAGAARNGKTTLVTERAKEAGILPERLLTVAAHEDSRVLDVLRAFASLEGEGPVGIHLNVMAPVTPVGGRRPDYAGAPQLGVVEEMVRAAAWEGVLLDPESKYAWPLRRGRRHIVFLELPAVRDWDSDREGVGSHPVMEWLPLASALAGKRVGERVPVSAELASMGTLPLVMGPTEQALHEMLVELDFRPDAGSAEDRLGLLARIAPSPVELRTHGEHAVFRRLMCRRATDLCRQLEYNLTQLSAMLDEGVEVEEGAGVARRLHATARSVVQTFGGLAVSMPDDFKELFRQWSEEDYAERMLRMLCKEALGIAGRAMSGDWSNCANPRGRFPLTIRTPGAWEVLCLSAESREEAREIACGFPNPKLREDLDDLASLRNTVALGVGISRTELAKGLFETQRFLLTPDFTAKLIIMRELADAGCTAILCGETGTGKTELVNMLAVLLREQDAGDDSVTPNMVELIHDFAVNVISCGVLPLGAPGVDRLCCLVPAEGNEVEGQNRAQVRAAMEPSFIVANNLSDVVRGLPAPVARDVLIEAASFFDRVLRVDYPLLAKDDVLMGVFQRHARWLRVRASEAATPRMLDGDVVPTYLENAPLAPADADGNAGYEDGDDGEDADVGEHVEAQEGAEEGAEEGVEAGWMVAQGPAVGIGADGVAIGLEGAAEEDADDATWDVRPGLANAGDLHQMLNSLRAAKVEGVFHRIQVSEEVTPDAWREYVEQVEAAALASGGAKVVGFADETNTASILGMVQEVTSNGTLDGRPLPPNIFWTGAINPRVRSSVHMEDGDAEHGESYIVNELSESMEATVLQAAELSPDQEEQFVTLFLRGDSCPLLRGISDAGQREELAQTARNLILFAQDFVRSSRLHRVRVSFRDMVRCLQLADFLIEPDNRHVFLGMGDRYAELEVRWAAMLVATSIVYMFRLPPDGPREDTEGGVAQWAPHMLDGTSARTRGDFTTQLFVQQDAIVASGELTGVDVDSALSRAVDALQQHLELPSGIAATQPLKENLYATVVCTQACIPLLLTGPPGCGKTLSVQIATSNMRGSGSPYPAFRQQHNVQRFAYQCSEGSSAAEIKGVYESAIERQRFYTRTRMGKQRMLVVLDEASLPPQRRGALKVTHYFMDRSGGSDRPLVATVMNTNETLDAAKTNRAVQLVQLPASHSAVAQLARGVMKDALPDERQFPDAHRAALEQIEAICEAFAAVSRRTRLWGRAGVYQQRDLVYLLRFLRRELLSVPAVERAGADHVFISRDMLLRALRRNLGGASREDFAEVARTFLALTGAGTGEEDAAELQPLALQTLRDALQDRLREGDDPNRAAFRHVLVVDRSASRYGLALLENVGLVDRAAVQPCAMSDFAGDRGAMHRSQVASDVKVGVEQGRTVVLINASSVFSAFYDLFNKHYSILHRDDRDIHYANVGLGSLSRPCEVHPDARVIVYMTEAEARATPLPFLNRFEKYELSVTDFLEELVCTAQPMALRTPGEREIARRQLTETMQHLRAGVEDFVSFCSPETFYGLNLAETVPALLYNALERGMVDGVVRVPHVGAPFRRRELRQELAFGEDEDEDEDEVEAGAGAGVEGEEDSHSRSDTGSRSSPHRLRHRGVSSRAGSAREGDDDVAPHEIRDAQALLRQMIRLLNFNLLQLARPERMYDLRHSLHAAYIHEYMELQEHFSGARLLHTAVSKRRKGGSAPSKLLVLTRTHEALLAVGRRRDTFKALFEDIPGVSATANMISDLMTAAQCRDAIRRSVTAEPGADTGGTNVLVLVADLATVTSHQIAYVTSEVDAAVADAEQERVSRRAEDRAASDVMVCLLCHFSPERDQLGSAVDCVPLNEWEYIYCDAFAGEAAEEEAEGGSVDQSLVDPRRWMRLGFGIPTRFPERELTRDFGAMLLREAEAVAGMGAGAALGMMARRVAGLHQTRRWYQTLRGRGPLLRGLLEARPYLVRECMRSLGARWGTRFRATIEEVCVAVAEGRATAGLVDEIRAAMVGTVREVAARLRDSATAGFGLEAVMALPESTQPDGPDGGGAGDETSAGAGAGEADEEGEASAPDSAPAVRIACLLLRAIMSRRESPAVERLGMWAPQTPFFAFLVADLRKARRHARHNAPQQALDEEDALAVGAAQVLQSERHRPIVRAVELLGASEVEFSAFVRDAARYAVRDLGATMRVGEEAMRLVEALLAAVGRAAAQAASLRAPREARDGRSARDSLAAMARVLGVVGAAEREELFAKTIRLLAPVEALPDSSERFVRICEYVEASGAASMLERVSSVAALVVDECAAWLAGTGDALGEDELSAIAGMLRELRTEVLREASRHSARAAAQGEVLVALRVMLSRAGEENWLRIGREFAHALPRAEAGTGGFGDGEVGLFTWALALVDDLDMERRAVAAVADALIASVALPVDRDWRLARDETEMLAGALLAGPPPAEDEDAVSKAQRALGALPLRARASWLNALVRRQLEEAGSEQAVLEVTVNRLLDQAPPFALPTSVAALASRVCEALGEGRAPGILGEFAAEATPALPEGANMVLGSLVEGCARMGDPAVPLLRSTAAEANALVEDLASDRTRGWRRLVALAPAVSLLRQVAELLATPEADRGARERLVEVQVTVRRVLEARPQLAWCLLAFVGRSAQLQNMLDGSRRNLLRDLGLPVEWQSLTVETTALEGAHPSMPAFVFLPDDPWHGAFGAARAAVAEDSAEGVMRFAQGAAGPAEGCDVWARRALLFYALYLEGVGSGRSRPNALDLLCSGGALAAALDLTDRELVPFRLMAQEPSESDCAETEVLQWLFSRDGVATEDADLVARRHAAAAVMALVLGAPRARNYWHNIIFNIESFTHYGAGVYGLGSGYGGIAKDCGYQADLRDNPDGTRTMDFKDQDYAPFGAPPFRGEHRFRAVNNYMIWCAIAWCGWFRWREEPARGRLAWFITYNDPNDNDHRRGIDRALLIRLDMYARAHQFAAFLGLDRAVQRADVEPLAYATACALATMRGAQASPRCANIMIDNAAVRGDRRDDHLDGQAFLMDECWGPALEAAATATRFIRSRSAFGDAHAAGMDAANAAIAPQAPIGTPDVVTALARAAESPLPELEGVCVRAMQHVLNAGAEIQRSDAIEPLVRFVTWLVDAVDGLFCRAEAVELTVGQALDRVAQRSAGRGAEGRRLWRKVVRVWRHLRASVVDYGTCLASEGAIPVLSDDCKLALVLPDQRDGEDIADHVRRMLVKVLLRDHERSVSHAALAELRASAAANPRHVLARALAPELDLTLLPRDPTGVAECIGASARANEAVLSALRLAETDVDGETSAATHRVDAVEASRSLLGGFVHGLHTLKHDNLPPRTRFVEDTGDGEAPAQPAALMRGESTDGADAGEGRHAVLLDQRLARADDVCTRIKRGIERAEREGATAADAGAPRRVRGAWAMIRDSLSAVAAERLHAAWVTRAVSLLCDLEHASEAQSANEGRGDGSGDEEAGEAGAGTAVPGDDSTGGEAGPSPAASVHEVLSQPLDAVQAGVVAARERARLVRRMRPLRLVARDLPALLHSLTEAVRERQFDHKDLPQEQWEAWPPALEQRVETICDRVSEGAHGSADALRPRLAAARQLAETLTADPRRALLVEYRMGTAGQPLVRPGALTEEDLVPLEAASAGPGLAALAALLREPTTVAAYLRGVLQLLGRVVRVLRAAIYRIERERREAGIIGGDEGDARIARYTELVPDELVTTQRLIAPVNDYMDDDDGALEDMGPVWGGEDPDAALVDSPAGSEEDGDSDGGFEVVDPADYTDAAEDGTDEVGVADDQGTAENTGSVKEWYAPAGAPEHDTASAGVAGEHGASVGEGAGGGTPGNRTSGSDDAATYEFVQTTEARDSSVEHTVDQSAESIFAKAGGATADEDGTGIGASSGADAGTSASADAGTDAGTGAGPGAGAGAGAGAASEVSATPSAREISSLLEYASTTPREEWSVEDAMTALGAGMRRAFEALQITTLTGVMDVRGADDAEEKAALKGIKVTTRRRFYRQASELRARMVEADNGDLAAVGEWTPSEVVYRTVTAGGGEAGDAFARAGVEAVAAIADVPTIPDLVDVIDPDALPEDADEEVHAEAEQLVKDLSEIHFMERRRFFREAKSYKRYFA